jgi:hypothetical protein
MDLQSHGLFSYQKHSDIWSRIERATSNRRSGIASSPGRISISLLAFTILQSSFVILKVTTMRARHIMYLRLLRCKYRVSPFPFPLILLYPFVVLVSLSVANITLTLPISFYIYRMQYLTTFRFITFFSCYPFCPFVSFRLPSQSSSPSPSQTHLYHILSHYQSTIRATFLRPILEELSFNIVSLVTLLPALMPLLPVLSSITRRFFSVFLIISIALLYQSTL